MQRPEYDRLRAILVREREARRVSQRQLSKNLGMMPTYISKVERGERRIDVIELADIAVALGIDPRQILAETMGLADS